MKKYLITLFLLLASASYAQPPRIDSMFVDEAKSELQIHGDFGATEGKVWVDSVEMLVKSWTDTLIIDSIPNIGRGAAGPVVVGGRGYKSESRMLTLWGIGVTTGISHIANYYLEYTHTESKFFWRLDLDSRLRRASYGINYFLYFNETFTENYTYHLENNNPGQPPVWVDKSSTSDGINPGRLDLNTLTLYANIYGNNIVSKFDSNLIPSSWAVGDPNNGSFMWGNQQYFPTEVKFPPSKSTLALWYKPNLISPLTRTIFSYVDNITLKWDSLSQMTVYHVQVSTDSLFKSRTIDTTISSLNFSLPALTGLTQYFWRVAGVNSEGESRWSDVWNFATGTTVDVRTGSDYKLSLSSFPNPSSKELTITYSLPESGNTRIILYDLEGRIIREDKITDSIGEYQMRWDVSQLPSGSYVLGLVMEKESKSEIVKIVR